jgi:phage-related protein
MDNLRFGGIELPPHVGLLGYKLGSPQVDVRTVDAPARQGLIRTGRKVGGRTVTLELAILADGAGAMDAEAALLAWCHREGPAELYLPGRMDRYLMAEVQSYPEADHSKPGETFNLTLFCADPVFHAALEHSAEAPGSFITLGTAATSLQILRTFDAEVSTPAWRVDDRWLMRLTGGVGPGTMVIDTATGTATLDGEDITDQFTLESDPCFTLAPGLHEITGSPGTVRWRDCYIG